MSRRRTAVASIDQHELAAVSLLEARIAVHRAMRQLGSLDSQAGMGGVTVRESSAIMKIERAIDHARHVCEKRMLEDHPNHPTLTYYPGR